MSSARGRWPCELRIGGAGKAELLSRLLEARVRLNPMAEQLFADPRFTTAADVSVVEVVAVTVHSLGFADGATFAQLTAQASSQGLSLCPLELAPCLRLQFAEQDEARAEQAQTPHQAPRGALTVASAPPDDEVDGPWGFYLRRTETGLWLRGYRSWSGHLWSAHDQLAFMRAQNAA